MIITTHKNHDLALQIKELRNKYKVTQKELAEMIGYNHITVSRWEKGEQNISVDMLLKVMKALSRYETVAIKMKKSK